eukprot:9331870-Pyramimonas_sp.AAC.1
MALTGKPLSLAALATARASSGFVHRITDFLANLRPAKLLARLHNSTYKVSPDCLARARDLLAYIINPNTMVHPGRRRDHHLHHEMGENLGES